MSDERCEVAARLRELPSDAYTASRVWQEDGLFIDVNIGDEADYSQIHNAVFGCFPAEHMHPGDYEELHNRLADLIDRPTCEDTGDCWTFHCSACGCELDLEDREGEPTMWLGGSAMTPRHCPNCGARVVD